MIKKILDLRDKIHSLRDEGIQRGKDTGFRGLDALYSVKLGYSTIIQGAPGHGKSEFIFELIFNQLYENDEKAIILSPETGNAEEIAMELIHKYLEKSAYKSNEYSCDQKHFSNALAWVDYKFAIADDEENSFSFKDLSKKIAEFEKANKVKYSFVMAEPWNELDHKQALADNGGRQDLSIEDELSQLRRYCKKENKHVFLSFHPAHQELQKDKETNVTYYPMPKAREAAGGQATLRKSFNWINIWRPPLKLINPDLGIPYAENELIVQVEKTKPKGVGMKGATTLFFDWKRNRYYEKINGDNCYAFEHKKQPVITLIQSRSFTEAINEMADIF